eukprot:gene9656-9816_t
MGLNGVDNGQVWFDNLRVPRDALLDRYASVDAAGNYSSPIPTVSGRFGTMVGGLTMGRILIAQGAVDACKIGSTIALRYSAMRPQFGDKLIMDYLTHQRRLLPGLATAYALQLGMKQLKNCRECCGGQGFLSANKIGSMKTDMDVDVTFEGDNTVMMQQVARALLDDKSTPAALVGATQRVPLANSPSICSQQLLSVLKLYESSLIATVRDAFRSAGSAAAAQQAFDDNLDLVLELGWVHIERLCLGYMLQEAEAAGAGGAAGAQAGLSAMTALFGATRIERHAAGLMRVGLLNGADMESVRAAINSACRQLGSNGAGAALRLCQAFAIPDHLLAAPIAFNWRGIVGDKLQ